MLRDRIRDNVLRVRLPLNVVNAAGQRASHRTLTAPYYPFSVFLTPMETDLGWSRAETTGA